MVNKFFNLLADLKLADNLHHSTKNQQHELVTLHVEQVTVQNASCFTPNCIIFSYLLYCSAISET